MTWLLAIAAAVATALVLAPHGRAPRIAPATARTRPTSDEPTARRHAHRLAGGTALVALALVAPPLALAVPALVVGRRRLAERRRRRRHAERVRRSLPDAVDLLVLLTSAGTGLALAQPLVAAHCPGPVGEALASADRAAGEGSLRGDALIAALHPLGDRARSLAHVLASHLRYGVPLVPALERLRLELRLDRRRHAEQAARRVPVRLLGPLVACTLPAFALLTVVPLLAASLRSLPS